MKPSELGQRRGTQGGGTTGLLPARAPAASFGVRVRSLLLTAVLVVGTLVVGWLVWSVFEWRNGRTASYRLMGLRVVQRSDGRPIGVCRSLVRNALCCTVLLVPTVLVCMLLGFVFVMGASPPSGLLRRPRAAPWDVLTSTEVLDERGQPLGPSWWRLARWPDDVPVSMN
jgi:hypothetical protein